MTAREQAAARAQTFFDDLWKTGDYWQLDTSPFERAESSHHLTLLSDRNYARVLEIGCGTGAFTRMLATVSRQVLALDVSPVAIERACRVSQLPNVEFRAANVMDAQLEGQGPWDLVVLNETIYYLGWLYPFFDVAWLAERLFAQIHGGGRLLMANTFGYSVGYLLRPSVIRTYRDLFVNVGFSIAREEIFKGTKEATPIELLVTLFERPVTRPAADDGTGAPR